MTTYSGSAVSDTVIAFKKPITLQQGRALRNNLLATAEGDTTAPYIHHVWHPYNGAFWNDGATGRIWSFAVNGAVATVTSADFVDGYEYGFLFEGVGSDNVAAGAVLMNAYRETTAAYSGTFDFGAVTTSTTITARGFLYIHRPRTVQFRHFFESQVFSSSGGTGVNAASTDLTQWSAVTQSTAQKLLRVQFSVSGANFNAGAIYQLRRRVYG